MIRMIGQGRFGQQVSKACEGLGIEVSVGCSGDGQMTGQATWLVMGCADLDVIISESVRAPEGLTAAFLCGRYLVVTPFFSKLSCCASCFKRRFLSMPPPGLSSESVVALSRAASIESGFDHQAVPAGLPALAAALLQIQTSTASAASILIDQGGIRHTSGCLVPVHGCECRRQPVGIERFTSFLDEVSL